VDEELRSAIALGLHVENLWAIVRISTNLLQSHRIPNPIIALTISAVCTQLALRYEGQAVSADYSDLIDAHLLPAITRLLDVAQGSALEVCDALNDVASVYADTLSKS